MAKCVYLILAIATSALARSPKECPNLNEVYVSSSYTEPTCDRPIPTKCEEFKACRCDSGFVRHKGRCIKLEECPHLCKSYEELIKTSTTEPSCSDWRTYPIRTTYECRCKEGLLRDNDRCVPPEKCPNPLFTPEEDAIEDFVPDQECKDSNEILIETNKSELTCDCMIPERIDAVTECRCKPNYVRWKNACIKPEDCPQRCGINETYSTCCTEDVSCDDVDLKLIPPISKCFCKNGYARYKGDCIRIDECPKRCKDPNEEFILALFEELTCDVKDLKPIIPVKECRCKNGYVRYHGRCINSTKCPVKCSKNEEYILATKSERTCDDQEPRDIVPIKQCRCKPEFVRHNGRCISPVDCPIKCLDVNEEYRLVKTAERTCANLNPEPINPVKRCQCKDGFVRYKNKCIFIEECPQCNVNEKFISTIYTEPSCENLVPVHLNATVEECRCVDDYFRGPNGTCIHLDECPPNCGENEEYIRCNRSEGTCEDPEGELLDDTVRECRCKKGYLRFKGKCIKQEDCPRVCMDPNEEYVLAVKTEPTCEQLEGVECPPEKKCVCKKGFARYKGHCIRIDQCPVTCKSPLEDYTLALFKEPTCKDRIPRSIYPVKECRCQVGYVRHNGECINPEDCPLECNDPNEEYITTTQSELTCDNRVSSAIPIVAECRCKPGYVRWNKKCIPLQHCPVKCADNNEEYILTGFSEPTCADQVPKAINPVKECRCKRDHVRHDGKCIHKADCFKCKNSNEEFTTAIYSEPTCCNRVPTHLVKPVKECRCKANHFRHDGKCVPPEECPAVTCEDPNEKIVTTIFSEQTCKNLIPEILPALVTECRCISPYVRHNGVCILQRNCPKQCFEANEVFTVTSLSEPTCRNPLPELLDEEIAECRCETTFYRHNGKCIQHCDCPSTCSDPNEEFIGSVFTELTCKDEPPESIPLTFECRCKADYVRHEGACITKDKCPLNCTQANEAYVTTTLSEPSCHHPIPTSCKPFSGCRCKKGHFRNASMDCVLPSECPPGINEDLNHFG